jgi:FixJ family two-component response regulator
VAAVFARGVRVGAGAIGEEPLDIKPLVAIVDDDEAAREAVASLVRSLGFRAAEFASASAFLQSSRRAQTACLLVDMRMPGMTGLELHQHLRDGGTPAPTIIMTAHADEATRQGALHAGVHCYLPKPLQPNELLACIRSALADQA